MFLSVNFDGFFLETNTQGHLPFDDPNIRSLVTKVKNGHYEMPDLEFVLQDLISKILNVDPAKRLTLDEVKEHPAFRIGLPDNYIIPTPLPVPLIEEPMEIYDIDPRVISILTQIGYDDMDELIQDLESHEHKMVKSFCRLLSKKTSIEELPWPSIVNSEKKDQIVPDDLFKMPPQTPMIGTNFTVSDPFKRLNKHKGKRISSIGINSNAVRADWDVEDSELAFNVIQAFLGIVLTPEKLMIEIQNYCKDSGYEWFFPNEYCLMCHNPDVSTFIVAEIQRECEYSIKLTVYLVNGSTNAYNLFINDMSEKIALIQETLAF